MSCLQYTFLYCPVGRSAVIFSEMKDNLYEVLSDHIGRMPVISTHEHHLRDSDQNELTLEGIFEHSYVGWQGIPVGNSKKEHAEFLDKARYNSYFIWLQKALWGIYQVDSRITADNWSELSEKIKTAHGDPDFHLRVLREHCRYKAGLSDIYWDPGSDLGHPEIFKPVVRSDVFITCFHPDNRDHDGNSPWKFFTIKGLSFKEYVDFIIDFHRKKINAGAVAFKLATAYERTIGVQDSSFEKAARVYLTDPKEVHLSDKLAYGDYLIHRLCELAGELNVPFQIHTGLGQLSGSNPLLIEPLIERYPQTKFVLFHGGYPWYHEIGALAHNHSNVLVDLVWLPLISTTAAVSALHEYIEVVPSSDRIAWGSDSWTSEEAFGALMAFQHVLASVLAQKVQSSYIGMEDAKDIAEKLMYRNARKIYNLANLNIPSQDPFL